MLAVDLTGDRTRQFSTFEAATKAVLAAEFVPEEGISSRPGGKEGGEGKGVEDADDSVTAGKGKGKARWPVFAERLASEFTLRPLLLLLELPMSVLVPMPVPMLPSSLLL